MNTNRLSDKMASALNHQMTKEAHASQIYLSYASWLTSQGYNGIANFLFRHAQEERNHMMKILEYILSRGAKVRITEIPSPPADPKNVYECIEKVFQHEVDNTNAIYDCVNLSHDEKDWITFNFLQWFVKEQTEEESLAMNLIDKFKIAGGDKADSDALYSLDRDLESAPDDAKLAQDATADNP